MCPDRLPAPFRSPEGRGPPCARRPGGAPDPGSVTVRRGYRGADSRCTGPKAWSSHCSPPGRAGDRGGAASDQRPPRGAAGVVGGASGQCHSQQAQHWQHWQTLQHSQ